MLRKTVIVCAFILTGLIIAGLVVILAIRPPVEKCNAEDFWYLTCRVDIGSQYVDCLAGGDYAVIQGEWVIFDFPYAYYYLAKVDASEILETFPCVLEKLEQRLAKNEPNDWVANGYADWKQNYLDESNVEIEIVPELVSSIESAFTNYLYHKEPACINIRAEYFAFNRFDFDYRLRQVKWFWATVLFEFCCLAGLVWFLAWPIIRRMHWKHLVIRMGLAPVWLFLPYFLGYAQYTFTSLFPRGGFLYPFVIAWFPIGSMNSWDRAIVEHLPQIFAPLSPGMGSPMVIADMGGPGPTSILLVGVVMAIATAGIVALVKFVGAYNPAGTKKNRMG